MERLKRRGLLEKKCMIRRRQIKLIYIVRNPKRKEVCDPRKTDQTNLHHAQPKEKKCRESTRRVIEWRLGRSTRWGGEGVSVIWKIGEKEKKYREESTRYGDEEIQTYRGWRWSSDSCRPNPGNRWKVVKIDFWEYLESLCRYRNSEISEL